MLFPNADPTKIVLISRDPKECPPCGATTRYFDKFAIEGKFEIEKLDGNSLTDAQLDWLRAHGLAQTPVLFTPLAAPFAAVAGFRPDVVKKLVEYAAERDAEVAEVGAA